ncbi:hypothetical protein [Aquibacillus koreensis]|uniref:hypothetical protein n=1 Tax=Aquibacillus koreensis TaxID=279446 RepID=UPI0023417F6B|nr:hypothetical protein [Aquibacillus koreensis]
MTINSAGKSNLSAITFNMSEEGKAAPFSNLLKYECEVTFRAKEANDMSNRERLI